MEDGGGDAYTLAMWRVKEGKEEEFIAAWKGSILKFTCFEFSEPLIARPGSKLLGTRHPGIRHTSAVGETPRSKSEVVVRRLSEEEARLASDCGGARNHYLRGVGAARKRSPPHEVRVGSRTGVELYDRADREERVASAGAVAASDGAVD